MSVFMLCFSGNGSLEEWRPRQVIPIQNPVSCKSCQRHSSHSRCSMKKLKITSLIKGCGDNPKYIFWGLFEMSWKQKGFSEDLV